MSAAWTITNPGGSGTSPLADLGLSEPSVNFRVMGVSTAQMRGHRDFDSADTWWAHDELVTIWRTPEMGAAAVPFFTGRVQECPDSASSNAEIRTLFLADAWQDLEEIIYRELWAIGSGSQLYPRAILGRNEAGANITTGEQIEAVIDYAITQGAGMTKGTIDEGYELWPSESRNASCESIITGEMRFHPEWVAWLDHSTVPPVFHARAKSSLTAAAVDVADEDVESFDFSEVKRTVPRGVSIVYESADIVDGEVYRNSYLDEVGETSGRRILRAMVDLEGMNKQFQKVRVQTRTIPTSPTPMIEWFKAKYPELADIPDVNFLFANITRTLVAEPTHAAAINSRATRLAVASVDDVPKELVSGTIEDWMRVRVGRVSVKYDLSISEAGRTAEQKAVIANFNGKGKSISVTATNATTKVYKGVSGFTAGEGRPEGLAAAIFAAATEQQWEGSVTLAAEDVPVDRWHGKRLTLINGVDELFADAVIHSASADIETGRVTLSFGPMGWLSAGDFLDLQRLLNSRRVMWVSQEERASNTLGSEGSASGQGDNVGGYDTPGTQTAPGGSEPLLRQWKATKASATTIDCTGGVFTTQPSFTAVTVADATALAVTESGHVILTIGRSSSTRAVTGTPTISYADGTIPASDYNEQIIPLAKVTFADDDITEIMPLKFEELHIFEDLAVVNGEFMLADLLLAGRNIYEPPPP